MNYKLSAELYGNNLWMIDPLTFNSMWSILTDMRNGIKYSHEGEKLNNFGTYDLSNAQLINDVRDLNSFSNDSELINIINLNGVITKNGGPSTNGTKQLASQILKMDSDDRVKGHLIVAGSGGGAGNAIKIFTDAIKSAKKPVGAWVEHGEILCSAAYGCVSPSKFIMAESKDVTVGSLGTMIELSGRPKESKDEKGQLHVRFYATKSTNKNNWFESAMNGDSKPIIEELLDPANETFLNEIKLNKPSINEDTQMDGSVFKAGDVLGTMVDSIGTFQDAINQLINSSSINNNLKTKKMTQVELQNAHPDVYNAIRNEGILAERDRVGTYMAHVNTDTEAVVQGIESGEPLSNTQREKFLIKQHSLNQVQSLQNDSAADLNVGESQGLDGKDNKEINEAFNFKLN